MGEAAARDTKARSNCTCGIGWALKETLAGQPRARTRAGPREMMRSNLKLIVLLASRTSDEKNAVLGKE